MARVDLAILQEIVRVIREDRTVPDRVVVAKHAYHITYLEDHRQRMEETLRRYDQDRLSMLFGQLASKVKYQMIPPAKRPHSAGQRTVTGASRRVQAPSKRAKSRARAR